MSAALNLRIDDETAQRLRARADEDGLTMEDEARKLLEISLQPRWKDFWQKADWIRERLKGQTFDDSADLIREDRDR